jgi:hypothetical protein
MKKYLLLMPLLLGLWTAYAEAQVVTTSSGNKVLTASGKPVTAGPASYVGPVATSTYLPNNLLTTASEACMTRKGHYMRSTTGRVKTAYANWRVDSIDYLGGEIGTGNSITVQGWIEYPAGTYTQLLFGGSTSATVADLSTQWSDFLNISIPKGALFYTWTYVKGSGGNNFPIQNTSNYANNILMYFAGGDKANCGTSGVPVSPSGSMTNNQTNAGTVPLAIIGDTVQPSFCLIGDSRTIGTNDNIDATRDTGDLARSIGPTNAYINMGVSGDGMGEYFNGSALRTALIANSGCSNVINELGVNQYLNDNATTAQWQTVRQNLEARFNGMNYAETTMEPDPSSTDSYKTTANQTVTATDGNITTSNDYVRGAGVPYVDLSNAVSTAQDSGKWQVNGLANYYTNGAHASYAGNLLIETSHVLNPRTLAANAPLSVSYPSLVLTLSSGSATYNSSGKFGQAITLTTSQKLSETYLSAAIAPYTLQCWAYITAYPTGGSASICGNGATGIGLNVTTGNAGITTGDGTQTWGATAPSLNAWHHYELDVAPETSGTPGNVLFTLYLDGASVASYNFTSVPQAQWASAQGVKAGDASHFAGSVDEVSLWNSQLHTSGFTPPSSAYLGSESGLIALWHFDNTLSGIRGPAGM